MKLNLLLRQRNEILSSAPFKTKIHCYSERGKITSLRLLHYPEQHRSYFLSNRHPFIREIFKYSDFHNILLAVSQKPPFVSCEDLIIFGSFLVEPMLQQYCDIYWLCILRGIYSKRVLSRFHSLSTKRNIIVPVHSWGPVEVVQRTLVCGSARGHALSFVLFSLLFCIADIRGCKIRGMTSLQGRLSN